MVIPAIPMLKKIARKQRLDARVQELYPALSRQHIQSLIMQGKVFVNSMPMTKSGLAVAFDASIVVIDEIPRYVSRAGFKLEKAIDHFNISVLNKVILDAGISTGGFTDCLLQNGAQCVYGVDVGYGQVHEKISADSRVKLFEKTNLRYFEHEENFFDLITLDLSFISLLKVCDKIYSLLKPSGELIVLIKPQFEADKKTIDRCAGVITDDAVRSKIVQSVIAGIQEKGFIFCGIVDSPISGAAGNKEFLGYFCKP